MNYLIAAYLVFWIGTLLYLLTIDRRQRETEHTLARLRTEIEKRP